MKSIKRNLSLVAALALAGLAAVSSPAPASAQSIFASPQAAHAAGMGAGYIGNMRQNATASPGAGGAYSNPAASGYATPADTTGGADPYAAIFSQIQTAASGLLSGPGALAFGVLILGLGFGVAWRLVTKGVKSIAK